MHHRCGHTHASKEWLLHTMHHGCGHTHISKEWLLHIMRHGCGHTHISKEWLLCSMCHGCGHTQTSTEWLLHIMRHGCGHAHTSRMTLTCHVSWMWANPYFQRVTPTHHASWVWAHPYFMGTSILPKGVIMFPCMLYAMGVSTPIYFKEEALHAMHHGCEHAHIVREETLCAIGCASGVTHTFARGRIIFWHAAHHRCGYGWRPFCQMPVCRLWMFGAGQFADRA